MGDNLSVVDPASPPAAVIQQLFFLVLAVTGGIFLLVEGLIVYCALGFRRRARAGDADPPQLYGSLPIEVAWTVAPFLIVFILFLVVLRTDAEVLTPPENSLRVTTIGHQWWWEYEYYDYEHKDESGRPALLFRTANELCVPVNQPVLLDLLSADVAHSWWVPRLAGKMDLIPGKTNRLWFQAKQAVLFQGQCAEYCGTQHANMQLRVVVQEPREFDEWLENQKKKAESSAAVRDGEKLFLSLACVNCHTVRGTPAKGRFGPDLTHLMSRQTITARPTLNNRENLRRWVNNPDDIKPGSNMPSLHLSAEQVDTVVRYLETLK
jgi:cytochrome c oxidase subunit 2